MKRLRKVTSATVNDLYASAFQSGMEQVADKLNKAFNLRLTYRDNAGVLEGIADLLEIQFDYDGNITACVTLDKTEVNATKSLR